MNPSSRNKALVGVVAVAVVASCAGGWVAARSFESPAQAAARTQAPTASRITVPVERRTLSADLVVRGAVRYDKPTKVTLAGPVGSEDPSATSAQLITRTAERGASIQNGEILAEVAGRPVFFLRGARATYRAITPGASGEDVRQLEDALATLGFDPGPRDGVYDAAAQAAVAALYTARGYRAQGLTTDQEEKARQLRKALLDAQANLDTAKVSEWNAAKPPKASAISEAEAAVRNAETALASALRKAESDLADAQSAVDRAKSTLDRSRVTKTEADAEAARTAAVKRDADSALATARSGGVNPTTGLSFTAAEIEQLVTSASTAAQAATQAAQAARESAGAIEAATAELRTAQVRLNDTPALNTAAVQQAIDSVTAAKLRKSEMNETSDGLSSARASTQSAQRSVQQANEELARELAKGGISLPAGEVVFVDADSVRVEEVTLNAGDAATGKLMTVTGARFAVAASVSTADRDLLTLGAKVTIEASDAGIETTGEITSIAEKAGTDGLDEQHVRVMISMDSVPTGAQQLNDLPVRITIPISSTGDTLVLVVPVAAVSLAADGTSRVEVETDPKKETKLVNVKPGISSNGLVQVDPLEKGSLNEGDRVVVGASGQESS